MAAGTAGQETTSVAKVPGPLNPSDMMTKHVDLSHIEQYIGILNLEFAAGRADIAQQLHYVEGRASPKVGQEGVFNDVFVDAHVLDRSVSLGSKSGGGMDPSSGRSQIYPKYPTGSQSTVSSIREQGEATTTTGMSSTTTTTLSRLHIDNYHGQRLPEKIKERMQEDQRRGEDAGDAKDGIGLPKNSAGPPISEGPARTKGKAERAEERHVDSWGRDGRGGRWTRIHRSARRALFTPYKVAGGPSSRVPLKRLRITRGKFVATGKPFKVIDDWSVRANAHRVLEGAWIGTTDFRETFEFIDDDSDDDVDGAEYPVEEEKDFCEATSVAKQLGEAANVEYYDLATPPEKSDPVCRQLFSTSRACRLAHASSVAQQGLATEGECEAGSQASIADRYCRSGRNTLGEAQRELSDSATDAPDIRRASRATVCQAAIESGPRARFLKF